MLQQQYYPEHNTMPIMQQRYRTVKNVLPSFIPGLIGVIQLLLWLAIIALEIVSITYHAGRGTIYAGFWCSIVFFITWISMLCYLCCGKSVGYGIYLVILNIISLIFAIILLVFTCLFLRDPCLCYGALCNVPNWNSIYENNYAEPFLSECTARIYRKRPILKSLIACAVLMLVCNIIFIVAYLIFWIRLRTKKRVNNRQINVEYRQPSAAVQWIGQPSPATQRTRQPSPVIQRTRQPSPVAQRTRQPSPAAQWTGQSSYYPSTVAYSAHHYQHQQCYPVQYTRTPSPWSSSAPSYELRSNKF